MGEDGLGGPGGGHHQISWVSGWESPGSSDCLNSWTRHHAFPSNCCLCGKQQGYSGNQGHRFMEVAGGVARALVSNKLGAPLVHLHAHLPIRSKRNGTGWMNFRGRHGAGTYPKHKGVSCVLWDPGALPCMCRRPFKTTNRMYC